MTKKIKIGSAVLAKMKAPLSIEDTLNKIKASWQEEVFENEMLYHELINKINNVLSKGNNNIKDRKYCIKWAQELR